MVFGGCSKRPFSKAAPSEDPGAYTEVREESERGRTPLVVFFNILLELENGFFIPESFFPELFHQLDGNQ